MPEQDPTGIEEWRRAQARRTQTLRHNMREYRRGNAPPALIRHVRGLEREIADVRRCKESVREAQSRVRTHERLLQEQYDALYRNYHRDAKQLCEMSRRATRPDTSHLKRMRGELKRHQTTLRRIDNALRTRTFGRQ